MSTCRLIYRYKYCYLRIIGGGKAGKGGNIRSLVSDFFGGTRFACHVVTRNICVFTCSHGYDLLHHIRYYGSGFFGYNLPLYYRLRLFHDIAVTVKHR